MLTVPIETKKDVVRWQTVLAELVQLRIPVPVRTIAGSPAR